MRKFYFIVAFLTTSLLFADNPIKGYWKSLEGKEVSGYWRLYVKNNKLYGICYIAYKFSPDALLHKCTRKYPNHPNANQDFTKLRRRDVPIVYGLKCISKGVWRDGYVIDSRNGRKYNCHITFNPKDGKGSKPDTLSFRGETKLGFGKTVCWERCTVQEINQEMKKNIAEKGSDYAKAHPEEFFIKPE